MVLWVSVFWVGMAFAGGTNKEAFALLEKAAAFVKAEGKEKAFADFTNTKEKFVDRDLYIFVLDFKGLTLAHGRNAKLVGKDMLGLKDADGEVFIQKMIGVAKIKGTGWVDYKWTNPVSKKIEAKTDGFVKSPSAALRFTFVGAAYHPSTHHSSGFSLRVPRNAGELFTKPSLLRLFTRSSRLPMFKNWMILFLAAGFTNKGPLSLARSA